MPEPENLENRFNPNFEQKNLDLHQKLVKVQREIDDGLRHPRDINEDFSSATNQDWVERVEIIRELRAEWLQNDLVKRMHTPFKESAAKKSSDSLDSGSKSHTGPESMSTEGLLSETWGVLRELHHSIQDTTQREWLKQYESATLELLAIKGKMQQIQEANVAIKPGEHIASRSAGELIAESRDAWSRMPTSIKEVPMPKWLNKNKDAISDRLRNSGTKQISQIPGEDILPEPGHQIEWGPVEEFEDAFTKIVEQLNSTINNQGIAEWTQAKIDEHQKTFEEAKSAYETGMATAYNSNPAPVTRANSLGSALFRFKRDFQGLKDRFNRLEAKKKQHNNILAIADMAEKGTASLAQLTLLNQVYTAASGEEKNGREKHNVGTSRKYM
jgi:hypothetical protein